MTIQTKRVKKIRRCEYIRKMTNIWSNSLGVIAVLGLACLFLSNFIQKIYTLLLFGQLMAIVSFAALLFQCFMLLVLDKTRSMVTVFLLLGSGGSCFGLIGQLMDNQIIHKPPILHISGVFIAVAIIIFNNKKHFQDA